MCNLLFLRGHVKKKKKKRLWKRVGGSSVQLEIKNKNVYIILLRFWASIRTSITL